MKQEFPSPADLDRQVAALTAAVSPSETFKTLLESARMAAPRASVFLLRQGQIKGWGCVGYGAEPAGRLRGYVAAADCGWLGEVAGGDGRLQSRSGSAADPDFGQAPTAESVAIPVRVKSKTIALLMAERDVGQLPWSPEALNLFVRVTCLRLDLDLAQRKLKAAGLAAPEAAATEKPAAPPPSSAADTGLAPAAETDATTEEADLEAARRFAKLVATDIRLYNEEAVMLGRKQGDLSGRLGDQLARGKDTFMRRHGDLGPAALDVLHEAYVEVLAGGAADLLSRSVLD